MATRTGSFGRLPRSAPDLSATIAALLAEYMAQVDNNMVDAWRNGGEVDGKAVTDSRLLKHFKKRRDELDPKDPEYQEWDNRITQYEFAIEESKMAVKWDNGQVSESEMAAFYRKWEKKTPDNTEFDRSLRKSFGQWTKSANARSAANNAAAEAAAHNRWVKGVYEDHVKPYDTANVWLSGLLFQWGPLQDAKQDENGRPIAPDNIGGLEAGSDDDFETLVALYEGGSLSPERQAQVDAFVKGMKEIDPKFEFTTEWFTNANDEAQRAIKRLEKNSTTETERNHWSRMGTNLQVTTNRVNAATYVDDAKAARELWEKEMRASHGNAEAQRTATEKYRNSIAGIATILQGGVNSFKNPDKYDTGLVPGLNNEVAMLDKALSGEQITGTVEPTWLDSSSGSSAQQGPDSEGWPAVLNGMNANLDVIEQGGWAVLTTDNEGNKAFIYRSPDQPPPLGLVQVQGYDGAGRGVTVYVEPEPVQFGAIGPDGKLTTGKPIMTDKSGNMLDAEGKPTTDPLQAATTDNAVGFEQVNLPDPNGDKTWYIVHLPNGQTARSLTYPLDPEKDGGWASIDNGDGTFSKVRVIRQDSDTAGANFLVSDYLSYGPKTAGATQTRPEDPYARDPKTDQVTGMLPGWYGTDEGAAAAFDLNALDTNSPTYAADRARIMNTTQTLAQTLRDNAFRAGERGDTATANTLNAQANALDSDFKNLMVLAVAKDTGDASSLGQIKAAETIKFTNATWDGSNVITGTAYSAGSTTSDQQLADARTWALDQVTNYDNRYLNTIGPAFDKRLYEEKVAPSAGSVIGWGGAPSDLLAHDPQYASLRDQIAQTKDPRLLKLPSGVASGSNPFLPQGPVTLPTGVQGGVGAPPVGTTPAGTPLTTAPKPEQYGPPAPPQTPPPVAPPPAATPPPVPSGPSAGPNAYTGFTVPKPPPPPPTYNRNQRTPL